MTLCFISLGNFYSAIDLQFLLRNMFFIHNKYRFQLEFNVLMTFMKFSIFYFTFLIKSRITFAILERKDHLINLSFISRFVDWYLNKKFITF